MSLFNIFNIAGSAMSAHSIFLNTTASNLANANSVTGSEDKTYRARQPIFETILAGSSNFFEQASHGVNIAGIVESQKPLHSEYNPGHPAANEAGMIFKSNVNPMEEMANMITASRTFQTQTMMLDTTKTMTERLLALG
jgi:flagellar basal-body rod protein FlgC